MNWDTKLSRVAIIALSFLLTHTLTLSAQAGYSDTSGIPQTNGIGPVNVGSISCGPISNVEVDYMATNGASGSNLFQGGTWTDGLTATYTNLGHTIPNGNEVHNLYTEVQNGASSTVTYDFVGSESNFELVIYDVDFEDNVVVSALDAGGGTITDCSGWTVNGTGDMTTFAPNAQGTAPAPNWDASTCTASSTNNSNFHRSFLSLTPDVPVQELTMDLSSGAANGMHVYYNLYCASVALPVELASFAAETKGDKTQLLWTTQSEFNNAGFEIEHAAMNQDFISSGFVSGQGNSTEIQNYRFELPKLEADIYRFRLKQIDFDGTATYSEVIEKQIGDLPSLFVSQSHPNPANYELKSSIRVSESQQVQAVLYTIDGRQLVQIFDGYLQANQNKDINIDVTNTPNGIYILSIIGEVGSQTSLVTVQH